MQIAFTFVFILSFINSSAQKKDFQFNQFTVKDGLSYRLVNTICQDKEGFLWIGTYDGLNRFDGKNFKVFRYNRRNPHSLPNNIVHALCIDKEDNIWGFARDGVVFRYSKITDSFDNYPLIDDSTHTQLSYGEGTILCDRQGVIWVGVVGGLFEFIPEKNYFKQYRSYANDPTTPPSNSIRNHAMVEDKTKQGLWIGSTIGGGLYYFDTKTKIAYSRKNNPDHLPVFDNHRIFPVCLTNNNKLVYGDNTAFELCFYDIAKNEIVRTKKIVQENSDHLNSETATIFCDSKNNLWITTWTSHFWRMDGATGEINEIVHDEKNPKSVNSNHCGAIFEDKEGTLWFGGTKGISYFNPQKDFYTFFRPDLKFPLLGLHSNIHVFFEDENDLLWFGTKGAGLFSYDFKSDTYNNYSFEKNSGSLFDFSNTVTSIVKVENNLWLGTKTGILVFNPGTKKFSKFIPAGNKKMLDSSYVLNMTKQNDSIIWFSDYPSGLSRLNIRNNSLKRWPEVIIGNEKISMSYIYAFNPDSENNVWISPEYDGWLKYNTTEDNFKLFKADRNDTNALPAMPVSKVVIDKQGYFWVLTLGQGLARFNPKNGETKTWNSSDGLVYDPSGAMTKDKYGKLWITGYNLLSVFEPRTKHFENYYLEFAESNNNYNNSMLTLHNGKIVSSMLGAFVLFDPEKQHKKIPIQNILISNFSVFGKSIPFTQHHSELSLSYKENFFTFDYSVVTGVEYDKIEYSYLLEGFDKDWVMAGKRQSAPYTNVPGGDYVFKVKARSSEGQWTEPRNMALIHISKIFYQTWWFRFLVALCMFLMIRIYVRYRASQQKKAEAEQAIAYFANSEYTNHNADEIVWDLARNCISRLGFVDCVIYLTDEERNVLVQKAALGDKSQDEKTILNPIEIPVGKGIVGSAASSGKTELIQDTSKDSRYITDDASRFSELAVPIINDGKVIGVIDSEHPRKNFFKDEHKRILETIASICSTKIVNAQAAQLLEENEKKLLEVDKRVAEVRLMALRAQMNPHFIFNCLNAIDNYVLKNDVEVASRYLNKFARLIRSILSVSDKNFISLRTELDLLNNYVELENLRFEEKFAFQLTLDDNINSDETDVPSMLIQPFVENAIVHGLVHKKGEKNLSIAISLEDHSLQCIIEDNGIGRMEAQRIKNSKTQTHESKGMKVTEGRLELLQQQVKEKGTVSIFDLKDDKGNPSGTRVEILIPIEDT